MPEPAEPRLLAPDYYLVNFRFLIEHVLAQYEDLLSPGETHFYRSFSLAGSDAQKLLVRMLMRRGEVFRADKLCYADIGSTGCAAEVLSRARLVDIDPDLPLESLLPLFSKAEWIRIIKALPLSPGALAGLQSLKRAEFDEAMKELLPEYGRGALALGRIYQLRCADVFKVFKLLFFGHLRQDLSEFVVRDLGHVRYESYSIHPAARLFTSRAQIEQHLQYFILLDELETCLTGSAQEILGLGMALPVPDSDDKTLQRRVERVRLTLARQLERLDCLEDALALYRQCTLPPARERSARILAKQNNQQAALDLCRQMNEQPFAEEERVFAEHFGHRLATKLRCVWPKPDRYQPPCQTLTLAFTGERVELAVARALCASGDCHYVENQLFCSLFALHYWEVIFAPVRGAFTHPFQAGPHDLFESDFLQTRSHMAKVADTALDNLSENCESYLALWRQKAGTAVPLAAWQALHEPLLEMALQRVPATVWRCIFKRLWSDLRHNRSGLPDLIHFPHAGGFELIEVKGPGDRLQANQQRWMAYFAEHDIPHKVVQVLWRD